MLLIIGHALSTKGYLLCIVKELLTTKFKNTCDGEWRIQA